MTKGDKVFAAYVADGEVVVEETRVAAVGERVIRIEDGGRAFGWRRLLPLGGPGYSLGRIEAVEALLAEREGVVLQIRGALARAEAERDLVMATVAGERAR